MGNTISTFWVLSQETLGLAPPSTGQQALREPTAALRVGFAKTEITAPEETPMGGYWLRGPTQGSALDPLFSSCTVIETTSASDEGGLKLSRSVAIVVLDLVGISPETSTEIQQEVKAVVNVEAVMVSCTHTHTGPHCHDCMMGFQSADARTLRRIKNATCKAALQAYGSLQDATMSFGFAPVADISVNRRQRVQASADYHDPTLKWFETAGKTKLGQREDGPKIDEAKVVLFRDALGNPMLTMFHFACHPVCIGKSRQQSADFCGMACAGVEDRTGAPAIYLQGACGDINPRQRGGGVDSARQVAAALIESVCSCIDGNSAFGPMQLVDTKDVTIGWSERSVDAPLDPLPTVEQAQDFANQQAEWRESIGHPEDAHDAWAADACVQYAAQLVERSKAQQSEPSMPMSLFSMRLGPVAFLGLPGEPFCEYQLNLEKSSPFACTLVCGYTNGVVGYIPTEAEFPWGGYEVVNSFRIYGMFQSFAPTVERELLTTANDMLEWLHTESSSRLLGTVMDSNFLEAHDTYNAIGFFNDKVYYVLSSEETRVGAKAFELAGASVCKDHPHPRCLGDLTEVCDPLTLGHTLVQGKSHVPFVADLMGNLWFGTHVGYYAMIDGMEVMMTDKEGDLEPYPGGCLVTIDGVTGDLACHARLSDHQGILTFAMDPSRENKFVLTWPAGDFVHFGKDNANPTAYTYKGQAGGEGVHPRTGEYRCVCRSMAVDPRTGWVYWSNAFGDILSFHPEDQTVVVVLEGDKGLRRDYLGTYDPTQPGSMAYNWRQVAWHPTLYGGCVIGVHGNSGYLFVFRPPTPSQERSSLSLLRRIASEPSQQCGFFDQFSYGYLGFALGQTQADRNVVYYLTGGPIFDRQGQRLEGKAATAKGEAKGLEYLHLVTYDLVNDVYKDHGPIFFRNRPGWPTYVNSLAVGTDGYLYSLARLSNGTTDLFRVEIPSS